MLFRASHVVGVTVVGDRRTWVFRDRFGNVSSASPPRYYRFESRREILPPPRPPRVQSRRGRCGNKRKRSRTQMRARCGCGATLHLATNLARRQKRARRGVEKDATERRRRRAAVPRRSAALRKAVAGRWPADVYNLALIAGPGEVVARERRAAIRLHVADATLFVW